MRWVDGRPFPEVLVWLGEPYSVGDAYDQAHRTHDAYLSPQGMFCKLLHGHAYNAFQFLQKFGPLTWAGGLSPLYTSWVDLNDFWARHQRFLAACELWENRESAHDLKLVWESIRAKLQQINEGGAAPFGSAPDFLHGGFTLRLPYPWEVHPNGFTADVIKQLSTEFVRRELTLHTMDCRLNWSTANEKGRPTLRPDRFYASLWGAIWDLFGRDISQKRPMLICKECGKLFYPKRSDSTCCCEEHQSLWSKREWAREKRKQDAKEKKSRSKGLPPQKPAKANAQKRSGSGRRKG